MRPIDEARPGDAASPRHDCIDAAYRTQGVQLLRFFRRHAPPGEDAQDLVQEAFARFAGLRLADALRNPEAMLQRIARNLLFNRYTHVRRWRALISNAALEDIDMGVTPDQSLWIEAEHVMDLYRKTLEAMPARTREIFLLHRVEDRTYMQIADDLGISVKAVEYHMASALKQLSKSLDRE